MAQDFLLDFTESFLGEEPCETPATESPVVQTPFGKSKNSFSSHKRNFPELFESNQQTIRMKTEVQSLPPSPRPTKRRRASETASSTSSTTRTLASRWSDQEEVTLQGVVVTDCNIIYAGQAPWLQIKLCFQAAAERFTSLNNLPPIPDRTSCALKKHYRVMHAKTRDGELRRDFWYLVYHHSWMSKNYNKSQRLIDYSNLEIL